MKYIVCSILCLGAAIVPVCMTIYNCVLLNALSRNIEINKYVNSTIFIATSELALLIFIACAMYLFVR